MSSYKQQLLDRLVNDGWEHAESIEIDEWWAEACWRIRSTKQQWGLDLFITFLVDPQWDGAHTGEKPPIWAIVATEQLLETWRPTEKVALLSMSKRHFATKLEEFAVALDTFRNTQNSQSPSNANEQGTRATKACDECGSGYFADQSKMAALCPECSHRLYGYANCDHEFHQGRCSRCHWDGSVSDYLRSRDS